MKAIAKQLVTEPIPLPGRRGKELLRFRAAIGQRGLQTALILDGGRRRSDLLPHQQPQPACRRVEVARHRINVAGALAARRDPAAVGQRFQMTTDRGLRELDDGADFGNGELLSLERSEEHTSELQSLRHLVCRLLLEKKNKKKYTGRQANRFD